eukprot:TRINITY_DN33226_c0_g1_i1.p1 TRINITY_DN33226_c0_g1~~TRINITY_DN33226_c0_g1_i1.p1  ORF type:complete len:248 (+),score=46.53 TRINITY_DN33226_c0_g1_i1:190-933(+)
MPIGCPCGVRWIWSSFHECVVTVSQRIGFGVGTLSGALWIMALLPQIFENHQKKAVEGLSLAMLLLFILGDVMNISGAVLADQTTNQIIIGGWQLLIEVICTLQWLYYGIAAGTEFSRVNLAANVVLNAATIILTVCVNSSITPFRSFLGGAFGYLSAFSYLGSRFPQIYHNYRRKSTEGLSFVLFVSSIAGNVTYAASVVLVAPAWASLIPAIPWLLGSLGTVALDVTILCQFIYYERHGHYKQIP